ncbi:MAG: hypothetical protein WAL91_02680, partial [Propionicimonas sp.]
LGTAIAAAINVLNPQVVALGGFLATLAEYDRELLDRTVAAATLPPSLDGVSITAAELGEDLLMVGAAGLAFTTLLADPAIIRR